MKTTPRGTVLRVAHPWQGGVTLLELMIVIAIIGILAAIAFPSYQQHVVKTYRSSAAACTFEHAQLIERFYTTNLTYAGFAQQPACRTENNLDDRYVFAVVDPDRNTYTITATPIGTQLAVDTRCGTLSIDQSGAKTVSGTSPVEDCW